MRNKLAVTILLCATLAAFSLPAEDPAESLAQTERDFAQMSMKDGMYKAFVKYAAESGIQFAPHPRNVRQAFAKQADGPLPDFTLNWRPVFTDVAASGDLGFNAGPWIMADLSPAKEPSLYGYFLSIWKRQDDGTWRFIIDAGVRVPPFPEAALSQAWIRAMSNGYKPAGKVDRGKQLQELRDLDAGLLAAVNSKGCLEGYRQYLADKPVLYRQGHIPAFDGSAVEQYLSGDKHTWTWSPIESGVSDAGDFAYSYGSYEAKPLAPEQKLEKGYYMHVWKRNAEGKWRLAADVVMPRLTPQPAATN